MHNVANKGNSELPEFISKAAAARALRVSGGTLDKIIKAQGIQTFQIPGHRRRWIDRAAVGKLAQAAVSGTGAAK